MDNILTIYNISRMLTVLLRFFPHFKFDDYRVLFIVLKEVLAIRSALLKKRSAFQKQMFQLAGLDHV